MLSLPFFVEERELKSGCRDLSNGRYIGILADKKKIRQIISIARKPTAERIINHPEDQPNKRLTNKKRNATLQITLFHYHISELKDF